ncbi:hypothetical protein FA13DRAFT_1822867 [Coprinellus micaceus]|uniref:Uncharacterized protein n=1 Tax=Coprinellus micaceus TaxID=71717 RepID=A0A4Y7S3H8_COPMI|nr:hypothetical protein FA13DRAFT_1822867 [Coprinellus micaceus]
MLFEDANAPPAPSPRPDMFSGRWETAIVCQARAYFPPLQPSLQPSFQPQTTQGLEDIHQQGSFSRARTPVVKSSGPSSLNSSQTSLGQEKGRPEHWKEEEYSHSVVEIPDLSDDSVPASREDNDLYLPREPLLRAAHHHLQGSSPANTSSNSSFVFGHPHGGVMVWHHTKADEDAYLPNPWPHLRIFITEHVEFECSINSQYQPRLRKRRGGTDSSPIMRTRSATTLATHTHTHTNLSVQIPPVHPVIICDNVKESRHTPNHSVFKAAQQDLVNLRSNSHPPADARPGGSFDSRFQSFEPSGSTFGPQGISPVKLSAAFAAEQDVESQGYLGKYPITQTHRDFQAHAQAQQAQLTLPPIDPLNYVALISTSANPQWS